MANRFEKYISKEDRVLRVGYTTGSCATAAAMGSLFAMLGKRCSSVKLKTPCGEVLNIEVLDLQILDDGSVICSVIKDAGDDPDVTNGVKVFAKISKNSNLECGNVNIFGGVGVGMVTKAGLDQLVGNHAINSVPRKMIKENCEKILQQNACKFGIDVEISIPKGVQLAEKTFNPKLGIVGGISVLGTSGLVYPMSDDAIVDTIAVEISQKIALEQRNILITPGNYGKSFLKSEFGICDDISVKCSNFIGETLELLQQKSAESFVLVGHIGKLIKLYQNSFNTHSKFGDGRAESFIDACKKCGHKQLASQIEGAVATDEMYSILQNASCEKEVMSILGMQICENIKAKTQLPFGVVIFSMVHGIVYKSENIQSLLEKIMEESK